MSVPYSEGKKSLTSLLAAARLMRGICWARAARPRAEITVSIPGLWLSFCFRHSILYLALVLHALFCPVWESS